MNLRKIYFVLIIVILIGNCKKKEDYLIVPGKRAGLIELNRPIPQEFYNIKGKPNEMNPPNESGDSGSVWYYESILIKLNDGINKENVDSIYLYDQKYHTKNGLTIGTSYAELRKIYPELYRHPYASVDVWYLKEGLSIFMDNDKVKDFLVFKPDKQLTDYLILKPDN